MQHQLVDLDRVAKLADQCELGGVIVVLGGVVPHHASVLDLGYVHGDISELQQLVDISTVVRGHHVPDARVHGERKSTYAHLSLDDHADTPKHFLRSHHVTKDDAEFVATQSGHRV